MLIMGILITWLCLCRGTSAFLEKRRIESAAYSQKKMFMSFSLLFNIRELQAWRLISCLFEYEFYVSRL